MELQFTKMHGAGNDFVFLDCLKHNIDNLDAIAKQLCDRRFGIGADGFAVLHQTQFDGADVEWTFFNNDGSRAEMCEVPVGREAVDAGILAHRRHGDAIAQRDAAQFERREEVW